MGRDNRLLAERDLDPPGRGQSSSLPRRGSPARSVTVTLTGTDDRGAAVGKVKESFLTGEPQRMMQGFIDRKR